MARASSGGQRGQGTGQGTSDLYPGTSRWAVAWRLSLVQACDPRPDQRGAGVILVLIGLAGRPLPKQGAFLTAAPLLELMLGIAMLAIASMTAGLLISAVVNSSDKTMPLLVVAVLGEVVLSGGVFRLNARLASNNSPGSRPLAGLRRGRVHHELESGHAAASRQHTRSAVAAQSACLAPRHGMQLVLTAILAGLTWWRLYQARPGRRH